MNSKTALISIHPVHVEKILSGQKQLEFRRKWAVQPVNRLVIYETAPTQKIVAVAMIKQTIVGSPSELWKVAQKFCGAITRVELSSYLKGRKSGIALELGTIKPFPGGIQPRVIFGNTFCPPQSFRYLTAKEELKLATLLKA